MVKNELNQKPLPGLNISMFASAAKGNKLFTGTTDAAGHFAFNNIEYYGTHDVKLTASNNKGAKRGFFLMDTIRQKPLPWHRAVTSGQVLVNDDEVKEPEIANLNRLTATRKINMQGNNVLKEVKIKAKSTTTLYDGAFTTFGYPDQVSTSPPKTIHTKPLNGICCKMPKGQCKAGRTIRRVCFCRDRYCT